MDGRKKSYNELLKAIEHWNEYRVPILRISLPDNDLNFHGAMRFYFQDAGQKVATKCVSVSSAHSTKEVIDVLIEKFRPDMRMLSVPEYGLYEIHESGDERKLEAHERPLFVQLEWNNDDREGRFLLRRMDEKTRSLAAQAEEPSLKRKLSKKEKKLQEKFRKQKQKEREKAEAANEKLSAKSKNGIAERLYNELPETSFTRSISNPEAVMKRRRAQKLEKLSSEGGKEAGGTLRIFGEALNKDVSYKTLLLSTKDTASQVVKQILEKYGRDNEDPSNYCLVQLIVPHLAASNFGDNNSVSNLNATSGIRETILDDTDCPLMINQSHDEAREGVLTFHIKTRPADWQKRRRKKPNRNQVQQNPFHPLVVQQLNQRLQMNNHPDQYSNQNSPQDSSQASDSVTMDINNQPPPFESVHSMPAMYVNSNGNPMIPYQHQQSISTATLPSRMNNQHPDSVNDIATLQRRAHSQQHIMPNKQFAPMVPNNQYPIGQQQQQQAQQQQQQQHVPQPYMARPGANDPILPALIQVSEECEDLFLEQVITNLRPTDVTFRLAPTYVLYMVSRYRASTLFHPELQAPSRADLFVPFTRKIATMIRAVIEIHKEDSTSLAFWLANSSDLSHFYKQDKHLSHFTLEAQEVLFETIKESFRHLLACKQVELDSVLNAFFDEREDHPMSYILAVLDETMVTMRKNRVNAALTIQIFSHLFHHISKWLFDRLIGVYDRQPSVPNAQASFRNYCNRVWGEKLNARLALIGAWAEQKGLEKAADFHLARVTQVTMFLARRYPDRITPQDLKEACDSCDRLNPVQLRSLLQRYEPETMILRRIIENLIYTMDYTYMAEDFPLAEDFELRIPFLIPGDGYSSEVIRYIPQGLRDFVSELSKIQVGLGTLCIFTEQLTSSGHWTVYFKNLQPNCPEVIVIQLRKKNNSMGLSIIAAKGNGQDRLGIYIKNVVKNGAAAMDGRLQAGDQLLEVDGNSLLDITQEMAAELMQRTGTTVMLKIAKQAAIYHNLSDVILSVPSQTIVSPQAVSQNLNDLPPSLNIKQHHQSGPNPTRLAQQIPDRKLLNQHQAPLTHLQQNVQPIERQAHRPDMQVKQNQRVVQFQQDRLPQQIPPPTDRLNLGGGSNLSNQMDRMHLSDREMLFQPPPPKVLFNELQQAPPPPPALSTNPTSPLKSPKKVSWVDTHPHQSLHTLIPPSPAQMHSPAGHDEEPGHPEAPSPPSQLEESFNGNGVHQHDPHAYLGAMQQVQYLNGNGHHNLVDQMLPEEYEEEEEEDLGPDSNGHRSQPISRDENHNENDGELMRGEALTDPFQSQQQVREAPQKPTNGQPPDATSESLTLEDIDEVLSSKTHNNWLEDSAGVIGTQEVYNDPRQRIVKERERPNAEVNIEGLTFREKLKMFDTSAKKE